MEWKPLRVVIDDVPARGVRSVWTNVVPPLVGLTSLMVIPDRPTVTVITADGSPIEYDERQCRIGEDGTIYIDTQAIVWLDTPMDRLILNFTKARKATFRKAS